MKNPIKRLAPNIHGRDFVIGDLHGSYSCFETMLSGIKFDPTVDRMISVGDLIDRGPASLDCLKLLREPWFHCVYANHEWLMVTGFENSAYKNLWMQNGGNWALSFLHLKDFHPDYEEFKELFELAQELPYLITIERPDQKLFHVLHAELPPCRIELTDEILSDPIMVKQLASTLGSDGGEAFLWARNVFNVHCLTDLNNHTKLVRTVKYDLNLNPDMYPYNKNLSHIISGHTKVQAPLTILGQTNIDTAAHGVYNIHAKKYNALTAVELNTWTFYQSTDKEFRLGTEVQISEKDLNILK